MAAKKSAARKAAPKRAKPAKRWSGKVTKESNALDLTQRAFTWRDPKRIALSLKRSAERSERRKASPYQSAMSMLTFYINRGGNNLTAERKRVLGRAKIALKRAFDRA